MTTKQVRPVVIFISTFYSTLGRGTSAVRLTVAAVYFLRQRAIALALRAATVKRLHRIIVKAATRSTLASGWELAGREFNEYRLVTCRIASPC